MDQYSVYRDIQARTGGEIYLGVVGPVRTGKSTFIKRFMEQMVLPYVNEIFDIIRKINADGVTVLLVEQNAKKALSIANRAYVLETGKIVLSGDAKELMNDDSVKKAYLSE